MKSNFKDKLISLSNDINKINQHSFKDDIKERLDKVLLLYLSNLNDSYDRLKCKKKETVFKELSK